MVVAIYSTSDIVIVAFGKSIIVKLYGKNASSDSTLFVPANNYRMIIIILIQWTLAYFH